MAEQTATGPGWLPEGTADRQPRGRLGLMIAWSQAEPSRVGEIALAPTSGRVGVLGRGAHRPEDEGERLLFARMRPGRIPAGLPAEAAAISRRHLLVRQEGGALQVTCVGKLPMLVEQHPCEQIRLAPGGLLEIERQMLLLCVERRGDELAGHGSEPDFAFGEPDLFGVVGESPRTWRLRDEISFFARRAGHVLLQGPSGTGKELAARALHRLSERHEGPFIARNAATLPPGIIDAELFGNARNYPNTGMRERPGLVGEAHGGTLFLDEIGELPEEMQAHLLRLLDSGDYHRLGEERARHSSARVLAATNREATSLKHDLLARFTLRLTIPGLGERVEDIPLIARALLRRVASQDPALRSRFFEKDEARMAPDLLAALLRHRYTTHVRELESLLFSAMAESREHFLALTPSIKQRLDLPAATPVSPPAAASSIPSARQIEESLSRNQGNVSRTWKDLGLSSRDALNRLLRKYNIVPRRP